LLSPQPDDNIYIIIQPDDNTESEGKIITQPGDNIFVNMNTPNVQA
jgi:hypothetical protein